MPDISEIIKEAITALGQEKVIYHLQSIIEAGRRNILTIISSSGNHTIPEIYLRGEIYTASIGNLDFTSKEIIEMQYKNIIRGLKTKLLEKRWDQIYLVPTGHPTLACQIKITIYNTTRLNSIDILYANGKYFDVDINLREV